MCFMLLKVSAAKDAYAPTPFPMRLQMFAKQSPSCLFASSFCIRAKSIGISLLCLLQQHFGLIKMGSEQGEFIVDAYPVSLRVTDLIVTFFTVIIAGNIATWYPVKYLSRRLVK